MSGFFRNPEIARALLWALLLCALCALAGLFVSLWCALAVLAACLLLTALFFFWTRRRYARIAALCAALDAVLHGEDGTDLDAFSEGELSILHDELRKMTVRLREQADRLRGDKARLADAMTDISHQLRTPLTAIRLNLSLLESGAAQETERRRLLQDALLLLDRFDWLLDALLKLARIDAGAVQFHREQTSALALVRRAVQPLLIPMELRDQALRLDVPEELTLFCDPLWTAEALGNILKNCMEHMRAGGTLAVRGSGNAIYAELVVEDDGDGIDPGDLANLFERFYRGKDAPPHSAGVGLALTRTILSAQDGTVRAENRREGGARFTVRLYRPLSAP